MPQHRGIHAYTDNLLSIALVLPARHKDMAMSLGHLRIHVTHSVEGLPPIVSSDILLRVVQDSLQSFWRPGNYLGLSQYVITDTQWEVGVLKCSSQALYGLSEAVCTARWKRHNYWRPGVDLEPLTSEPSANKFLVSLMHPR